MKNVKNVKAVSRLTGSLLAKKGAAAPSPASLSMNQAVLNRFPTPEYDQIPTTAAYAAGADHPESLESAIDTVKQVSTRQLEGASSRNGKDLGQKENATKPLKGLAKAKRIAMTLRMEEENHLRLRIFSAHTRKSCQVILSEALDLYFLKNEEKIPRNKTASYHR